MPKTNRKCPFENCGKDCLNTYCCRHQKIMGAEYPKFRVTNHPLYYITERNIEGNIYDGNGEECNDICFFGDVERYFGKSFHLETEEINDTLRYNGIYKRIYVYDSKYSYLHIILDKERNVRGVHIALIVKYEKYVNSNILKEIKRGEIGGCLFPLKFHTFTLNESKHFKGAGRQIIYINPEIQE